MRTRTIVITANEAGIGMTVHYPVWHERRPADRPGNVWAEPLRIKALDDSYPDNRLFWFDAPGTSAVVGREARLELVVPDDDGDVDTLIDLERRIAEDGLEGVELKRVAMQLAKVRGRIIRAASA